MEGPIVDAMYDGEPMLGAAGELWWWDDDTDKPIWSWVDSDVREALLRRDIDAGFLPALVRLGNQLRFEYDGDRDMEAEALLRQAVASGVPNAFEALAYMVQDQGHGGEAEALLRQGVTAGGRHAATSLAYMLHERGGDQQAYVVLREAAMSGGAYAHWILAHSMKRTDPDFLAISSAFYRNYDGFYSVPCGIPWTLSIQPAGSDSP